MSVEQTPDELFAASMKESGVDACVSHDETHNLSDNFSIRKETPIGELRYEISLDTYHGTDISRDDEIARYAREVSDKIRHDLRWTVNDVRVDFHDGVSAICLDCGESIDFDDFTDSMAPMDAEMCVPNPVPRTAQEVVRQFDEDELFTFKMLLRGLVKERCFHRKV